MSEEINKPEQYKETGKNLIEKIFSDRLSSPFYLTFITVWSIWNWRFLYALFFLSQDKIYESKKMLKDEYLYDTYIIRNNIFTHEFWFTFGKSEFWSNIIIEICTLALFTLIVYVIIFWFSKFLHKFNEKEEENKTDDIIMKATQTRKRNKEIYDALTVENKFITAKIENEKLNEDKLDSEYNKLKKINIFIESIENARRIIFGETLGRFTTSEEDSKSSRYIKLDYVAYLSTNNIINIDQGIMSLTKKGKELCARYISDLENF